MWGKFINSSCHMRIENCKLDEKYWKRTWSFIHDWFEVLRNKFNKMILATDVIIWFASQVFEMSEDFFSAKLFDIWSVFTLQLFIYSSIDVRWSSIERHFHFRIIMWSVWCIIREQTLNSVKTFWIFYQNLVNCKFPSIICKRFTSFNLGVHHRRRTALEYWIKFNDNLFRILLSVCEWKLLKTFQILKMFTFHTSKDVLRNELSILIGRFLNINVYFFLSRVLMILKHACSVYWYKRSFCTSLSKFSSNNFNLKLAVT